MGVPGERDPQKVWEDVFLDEIVTVDCAREVFKVAIDPVTRQIDWDRTKALRAAAKGA